MGELNMVRICKEEVVLMMLLTDIDYQLDDLLCSMDDLSILLLLMILFSPFCFVLLRIQVILD